MGLLGEYYNKFMDYLGWLFTRWWFIVILLADFLIRLPYGRLGSTPWIVYFIHLIDAIILTTIAVSIAVGIWRLVKKMRKTAKEVDEKARRSLKK